MRNDSPLTDLQASTPLTPSTQEAGPLSVRKWGRPSKEKHTLRTADIHLYFTADELAEIGRQAKLLGLNRQDYARDMLVGDRAALARRQPLPGETAQQFALLRETIEQQKQLLRAVNRVELDANVDQVLKAGLSELLHLFSRCHAHVNEHIESHGLRATLYRSQLLLEQTMALFSAAGTKPVQQIGQVQQKQLLHWQLLQQALEKGLARP